ncbi:MAG: hypothetical protein K9J76_07295 [Polaromonas sp.]|nr:hypothetical protein [Polaromonas sp.]
MTTSKSDQESLKFISPKPSSTMKASTNRKVCITLSPEQVQQVNEWMGPVNVAHFAEDCLPPGFELIIHVSLSDQWATLRCEGKEIELGDVEMEPLPGWIL